MYVIVFRIKIYLFVNNKFNITIVCMCSFTYHIINQSELVAAYFYLTMQHLATTVGWDSVGKLMSQYPFQRGTHKVLKN